MSVKTHPNRYFAALVLLLLTCGQCYAELSVSNVRASQRPGSRLVDIYYDLVTTEAPAKITVEVSDNGGITFNVFTATLSGDIGPGITTGLNKHIVWNALADRPDYVSTNMKFRVYADDGVPTHPDFDNQAYEFILRAAAAGDPLTDTGKYLINQFVREAKKLGFWNQMVYVPLQQGFGPLHTLGGSPNRTNQKFVLNGTGQLTPKGIRVTPGLNYVNRVQTPFSWDSQKEPVFVGAFGYVEAGPPLQPGHAWLRYTDETDNSAILLGSYYHSMGTLAGFSVPGARGGQFYRENRDVWTTRKPNFAGAQFDGNGNVLRSVINARFSQLTHATGTTGRPVGPIHFLQPASDSTPQMLQGCLLLYGNTANLPMKDIYALVTSTLFAEHWRHRYVHLAGQSNAHDFVLYSLLRDQWNDPNGPTHNAALSNFPNQNIAAWLGNSATAPFRTGLYQQTKNDWLAGAPKSDPSLWDPIFVWMQGENDIFGWQPAGYYRQQLDNLATFLREDLRPDIRIVIGQIDLAIDYRTGPTRGNVTLTGCEGAALDANGQYTITPRTGIAHAYSVYDWTKGDWRITKDGGTGQDWRVHKNGVVYYTSPQQEAHPGLIDNWTSQQGATGAPNFGLSLTFNLERIRKAQADFANANPSAVLVDTRGVERYGDLEPGADGTHITEAGYIEFARRIAEAYDTAYPP